MRLNLREPRGPVTPLEEATPQQPGLRIRVSGSNLLERFPDQFEPFTFFGCNLQERFEGTFFRFPLRTDVLAKRSEIKPKSCSTESVTELLTSFRANAASTLLFLRNVAKVEVFVLGKDADTPECLYTAQVVGRDEKERRLWQEGPNECDVVLLKDKKTL